jgi:3-phenylpropionate/trans-cinnamate dioxygenase ferredoxin component
MSEWKRVAAVADFKNTDRKFIEINDDVQIGLFKTADGTFHAVSPWCTHAKVSLLTGDVEGCEVICPLHGARFDLRDGSHLCLPAVRPLEHYPLRLEDGHIWVEV